MKFFKVMVTSGIYVAYGNLYYLAQDFKEKCSKHPEIYGERFKIEPYTAGEVYIDNIEASESLSKYINENTIAIYSKRIYYRG